MRYLLTVGAAIIVTAAVFLGMQALIGEQDGAVAEPTASPPIEMVRVVRDTPPTEKPRTLPQKPALADEPPPPAMPAAAPGAADAPMIAAGLVATPRAELKLRQTAGVTESAVTDAAASPIVRVNPTMPRKATIEQVEGAVIVAFDIGPTGSTENVRILEEDPPAYGFGAAAVRAVKRWRYRAKIVDGRPVVQKGLRIRLSFQHRD